VGDKKAKREIKRLHNAIDKAQDGTLDVVPTTIAGVAALLDYAAEHAAAISELRTVRAPFSPSGCTPSGSCFAQAGR
jgi:hypothetical protein